MYRYRELLLMITYRDIRIKYKQSIIGFLWAILMPAIIVLAGISVRYAFSIVAGKPLVLSDVVSISVRSLPWAFFVTSIRFGTNSLIGNNSLVTKIYFPKEIFPFAAVLASLFDFVVAAATLTILLVISQVGVSLQLLWVPLLIAILVCMVAGLALLLAAAGLFFRDVKYIVEVLLTFGIFFTPVLFTIDMFGKFGRYLLINPMAPLLEGLDAVINHQAAPDLAMIAYSGIFSLVMLVLGYRFFKNLEPAFAESI